MDRGVERERVVDGRDLRARLNEADEYDIGDWKVEWYIWVE